MLTPAYALTATERVLPRLALDFTTGVLDSRITVTRALNTATRVNSSGAIEIVNADLPRFDYDPILKTPKGLLIEEARQNFLTYSSDFTNGAWSTSNASISGNAFTAPDGTLTADQVNEVLNTSNNVFNAAAYANTAGQAMSTSLFLRYSSRRYVQVVCGSIVDGFGCVVDLVSKIITATGTKGTSTYTGSTITELDDGWVRVTVSGVLANANTGFLAFRSSDASTWPPGNLPVITGQNSYYIWGAQLEAGTFATSYIPTTTTSLARNADVVEMTGTNFSDWFAATGEGTFACSYSYVGKNPTFGIALQTDDGTNNNLIGLIGQENVSGNTQIGCYIRFGGANQMLAYPLTTSSVGTTYTSVLAYKGNDCANAVNTTLLPDTSVAVPTGLNVLRIGSRLSEGYLNGHIKTVRYWKQRVINAEVTAFSKS